MTGWLEANIVSILAMVASVVFFAAKLDGSNKAQKAFFENELKHITNLMALNHENLKSELERLREKQVEKFNDLKEDITRLELRQNESNRVKERLALTEASVKSAHHRLDRIEDTSYEPEE